MQHLTIIDIHNLLLQLAEDMFASKDHLTELDSAIGDGDLGVTMVLGFRAVLKELNQQLSPDISGLLTKCGMAFADNAASTFGALMSTMFLRSARFIKGRETIGPVEIAGMLTAATEGVQQRGKAQQGDKTVLDAMIPASTALQKAADWGFGLSECIRDALNAAKKGADETIGMKSNAGRSGWLGDRTIGVKDPGAAAFVLMLESISNFVETNKQGEN